MSFLFSHLGELIPPKSDPRADTYPLMKSWSPTALISLAYVLGVCAWRSELKKRHDVQKRIASNGKKTAQSHRWGLIQCLMVFYNISMVCYSGFLLVSSVVYAAKLGYGLGCVPKPDPNDRRTDIVVFLGYLFYFSKFIEMLDTVFFLWRGKVDQVTFLHVFHHAAMPPSIWWGMKYAPGGIVYMFVVANSFIHVIMYTYYGLAAAGLYKYLWWKNYLTLAQMLQFVVLIVHQGQIFVRSTPCDYPKIFPAAIIFYATVFLILFGNFYVQAYWRKQRLAKRYKTSSESSTIDKTVTNGFVTKNGTMANGFVKNGSSRNGIVANGHLPSHVADSGELRERKRRS
ncbi:unnamed protein product [Calicophoron daubneyi]|uniref:Elongation of very long chain fatty acids protein n=1 Tax=Calicophoron daubneyi TaxID=300641 RepID=A0AAV2TB81_CALDB